MILGSARQFGLCCVAVVVNLAALFDLPPAKAVGDAAQPSAAQPGASPVGQGDAKTLEMSPAKKKLIAEYKHGDFKLAEASGRLALAQQPNDMEIRYYLANTLSKLGKTDEAIFEYRQCVSRATSTQLKEYSRQGLETILEQKEAALVASLKSPARQKETELSAYQRRLAEEQIQAEARLREENSQAKRLAMERYSSRMRHNPRDFSSYQQSMSDSNFYQRELRAIDEEYFRKISDLRNHTANALSQTNCGKGTIRVMPSLSSSKVKNYINYSDDVEPVVKPLPESMNATALSLDAGVKTKRAASSRSSGAGSKPSTAKDYALSGKPK